MRAECAAAHRSRFDQNVGWPCGHPTFGLGFGFGETVYRGGSSFSSVVMGGCSVPEAVRTSFQSKRTSFSSGFSNFIGHISFPNKFCLNQSVGQAAAALPDRYRAFAVFFRFSVPMRSAFGMYAPAFLDARSRISYIQ